MDITDYIRFGSAFILVLALMGILGFILKRVNSGQGGGFMGAQKRLSITEQRMIDSKHKLVLIRRDDVEHLVILSNTDSIVIENGITPPKNTTDTTPRHKRDIPVESL